MRQQDRIEAGQEFELERLDRGDYRLVRRATRPNEGVLDWLLACPELDRRRMRNRTSPSRNRLERWFETGVQRLHCLPWEAETGLRCAELLAALRVAGRAMPVKDSLIAATALVHGLIVATRNKMDFEKAGVKIVNPSGG